MRSEARRYRAYPTPVQRAKAVRIAGCCRFVANLAIEQRHDAYQITGRSPGYVRQCADLRELRNDPELTPWLKEAPMQALQQALKDVEKAYKRFFAGQARYPRFHSKDRGASFRAPQDVDVRKLSERWGEVRLLGLGWVRVRLHRPLIGRRVTSATLTIEPDGKMFVSILCERRDRRPTKPLSETVLGVDRGVAIAVATSDGELIDRAMWTPKEKERLVRLERSRERQKKGSKNREETKRLIAAMHARARQRRQDFTEKVSDDLAKNHGLVVFEDLHIQAMTASAKGTVEEPGTNVRQKAGLNRAILNKGWGELAARADDKVARHGHRTMTVPAPYTSQTCPGPKCGHVSADNRATRSMFVCVKCGYQGHADLVAASNIRERGIKLALAGGAPVATRRGHKPRTLKAARQERAEPEPLGRLGSGNQEMGYSTEAVA
ncbi:MAG: RNA-guided endonuclease InsQ/TnpB family protein [Candidatus Dormibacteria bacterium]